MQKRAINCERFNYRVNETRLLLFLFLLKSTKPNIIASCASWSHLQILLILILLGARCATVQLVSYVVSHIINIIKEWHCSFCLSKYFSI